MDPSSSYLVCSYSNKSICMHDFITGEMVVQGMGHGEVITGVIFTPDCKRIISIGGDGCIFVWRLPALLSSRMHQKMNEGCGPLSPGSMTQPMTFSQIMLYEEDGDEEKLYTTNSRPSDNSYQPEDSKQDGFRGLHEGGAETFRFSISRLPRWAQDKVTNSHSAQINLESTPLQNNCCSLVADDRQQASLPPEFRIRTDDVLGSIHSSTNCLSANSSDSQSTSGSHVPQESFSGHHAMENHRWLSIYNVYLDLPSSPDMQNVMDRKSVSTTNRLQDAGKVLGCNGCSSDQASSDLDIGGELTSSKIAIGYNSGPHARMNEVHTGEMEEMLSGNVKCVKQAAGDSSPCRNKSEDSDLFKLHFGSLSMSYKKSESSARRRYSSKYVVQKDYLGGTKGFHRMLPHNSGCKTLNHMDEATINSPSEKLPSQASAKLKRDITRTRDNLLSTKSLQLSQNGEKEDSKRLKLTKGNDDSFWVASKSQEQQTRSCREVLLGLDAAAENAVQFFSRLVSPVFHEHSLNESGSELYDEAAKLLPSIIDKINAVVNLVQCKDRDKCGGTKDVI